jgi:hypothetical protein
MSFNFSLETGVWKSYPTVVREISELKQENAVAKAGIQRKDSLLMQTQQQWKTLKIDWEQRLELVKDEKDRLNTVSCYNGSSNILSENPH